jgi:hypothetical protein
MWKSMQANQSTMFQAFIELAGRPPAAAAAPAAQPDPWAMIERVVSLTEKLRAPQEAAAPTITVTKVSDDFTLVSDKNGDVNPAATAWANMGGLKTIVSSLRRPAPTVGGPGAGPQPAKRVGPAAAPNGAAKTNGSP